jgi:hypothetical protein
MTRLFAGGTAAVVFAMVAVAQGAGQTPQPQTPTSSQPTAQTAQKESAPEQQVTIVGCVQREDDYRRDRNLGRGGAAGTGAGVGNEFVLVNASTSTGATSSTPSPSGTPGTPTGTAGGASSDAYELTGKNEGQVAQYVGRRVEIVGKLKPAEVGTTGPTGGATAGAPPTGVDVMSKDLKLRELDVTSVRETTGTCPATQR